MDNTIIPYQDVSESSGDELDDSSSEDEYSHLLSNNIAVLYNKFIPNQEFMNMEKSEEYQKIEINYLHLKLRKELLRFLLIQLV